jgi:hypothetical protein
VSANSLKITYPDGDASSIFRFYVSPSLLQPNVKSWDDIQGIGISVSGNVDENFQLDFAGRYGGEYNPWYDHNFWRFEYKMPADFEGVPELTIEFTTEE